ncbi:Trm112 family protein [Francisellaceae bacterium]|nr:Trm112 family protein [Francisellaceae bacterium]
MDKKLLEILVCPNCGHSIQLRNEELICKACKIAYPIQDNVPVMVIEEARKVTLEEIDQL